MGETEAEEEIVNEKKDVSVAFKEVPIDDTETEGGITGGPSTFTKG